MFKKLSMAISTAISAACLCATTTGFAEEYPSRPITIVAPSSPGTPTDVLARVMGPEMSKILGQPVVVENKTGAGMLIGYEYVAKHAPDDGYTIVATLVPGLATLPAVVKNLRFNPVEDLPPFIGLAEQPFVFGSSSKMPWKNFNEFVAHAKANPGKLNFGESAALLRLSTEAVLRGAGLDVMHIPYSAGGPYFQSLVTGQVHVGLVGWSVVAGFGEKFRPLAVTGATRQKTMPDVPTFNELGFPQVRGISYSLNARAGIPKARLEKLRAAASKALNSPQVKERMAKLQWAIDEQSPEVAAQTLSDQVELFTKIAKEVGLEPQ